LKNYCQDAETDTAQLDGATDLTELHHRIEILTLMSLTVTLI